jgi:electron-transferring-flavoprotein dehydrogenase
LIVGGGPAGLSAAYRIARINQEDGGDPLAIAVIEKASDAGGHMLSGAVLDPSALYELIPECESLGAPLETPVSEDQIYFLTERLKIPFPITPPPLRNHGNFVISLNRFVKWFTDQVEAIGVDVFHGFSGSELLYEEDRVVGVRTGDRGVDRAGHHKSNFEPGVNIRAKVTILADGVRGNLTKTLLRKFSLDSGSIPQVYAIGIKELWELPAERLARGTVMHTLGYPLKFREFGGGFIYVLPNGTISVGLVAGLDYRDPWFDPHVAFQKFKQHPLVAELLSGGQMVRYGAKALPEGGWHAIPKCYVDGALVIGDAAGFLNSMRLKGIHLAMRSGMCAAEAAYGAVKAQDVSGDRLSQYAHLIESGSIKRELHPVRNVHQSFSSGLVPGLLYSGLSLVTGGWWFRDPMPGHAGHVRMQKVSSVVGQASGPELSEALIDRQLTFDKLTNVHYSGTRHIEDQPSHLHVLDTDICRTKCLEEYSNPCTRFCPANVYEMIDVSQSDSKRLQINASNCVHCKTCDIMDPYQIIDWVPPEGGGGPRYEGL